MYLSILTKLTSHNILSCDAISDHDYVIANIRKRRLEPWYKCIRNENQFISKLFQESAAAIPLSLDYEMYNSEDKLDIFNKLVSIVHINMSRSKNQDHKTPVASLKDLNINTLHQNRNKARK